MQAPHHACSSVLQSAMAALAAHVVSCQCGTANLPGWYCAHTTCTAYGDNSLVEANWGGEGEGDTPSLTHTHPSLDTPPPPRGGRQGRLDRPGCKRDERGVTCKARLSKAL